MTEESDIVKKIQRNNTREKEIIQVLEKKDGLAWEEECTSLLITSYKTIF